jgi:2-succinyl-5-enolpyruvyl-6-hydroxy-3-cyclohexene-1-carboxylate synthase
MISDDKIADFKPDILITLGGAVVSKKIKSFLRKHSPKQHWKIGYSFPNMDTYQCVTHVFKMHPVEFFHQTNALEYPKNTINYGALWQQKDILAKDKANELFDQLPYSDLRVFDLLFQYIPTNSVLHMANSSVVRYCQLFDPIGGIEYRGNRGTSGIDGSSSTAAGASVVNPRKSHVLITGDVSFFYDSNAFWNTYLGENLHIILLNNSGGGIFRIIPGPSTSPQRDTYFEATHSTDAKGICESYSINYQSADSLEDAQSILAHFFTPSSNGRPKLVEIKTPREENSTVLDAYFSYLKA